MLFFFFFFTDRLRCRRRLFKYWFFSPSCVLCRGDAIHSHKEQGDVNRCSGCRWKFGPGQLFMHGMQDLKMLLWKFAFLHIISDKRAANVNPGVSKMQNNLIAVVRSSPPTSDPTPRVWVNGAPWWMTPAEVQQQICQHQPGRGAVFSNSQLVKSLEKYESDVTEHGLNDGFGVLGGAQVSTEMRFNTVSHHGW